MRTPRSAPPAHPNIAPQDNPPLAASLLVSGLALLGLQDAIVKLTSSEISLWQMQFVRAMSNLILPLLLARFLW